MSDPTLEGAPLSLDPRAPRRVVIIGGGITGLTTAYRLLKSSRESGESARRVTVTLLEGSPRLGGNIQTERGGGFIIDGGPDAFVVAKPHATALCKEIGLGDRLIGTIPQNRKVYILHAGSLHPLPEGMFLTVPTRLIPMARTKLLSWPAKVRAALDLALPPKRGERDESIAQFVRRRLGREVAERIADPLLGGIYAGDLSALSIRATFPQLVDLEERHGSLIRGVLAQRARDASGKPRSGPPPSAFHSLVGGMGEIIDALAIKVREAGGEIRTRVTVEAVAAHDARALHAAREPHHALDAQHAPTSPTSDRSTQDPSPRFVVKVLQPSGGREVIFADDVILAVPAYRAAEAICGLDQELASLLREVPYESTATVVMAFPRSEVPHALDAAGLIIPKTERRRILAATFITSKWEDRAPPGIALMRVFVGGHRDPRALDQSDDALIDLARSELADLLGVHAKPTLCRVFRYARGSAQPILGHIERTARVRARAMLYPGLYLAGSAFDGVGIPDCVRQANEIAARMLKRESEPELKR